MSERDEATRQAIQRIVEDGVDLERSRNVEFAAFAPNEEIAQKAARAAAGAGYESSVFYNKQNGKCSVYIKTMIAIDVDRIMLEWEKIDSLLSSFSMFCDGWETAADTNH